MSLVKSREDARNDILSNRPLLYRVQFPVQNPVPKVTAIMYNNKLICSGPPGNVTFYHFQRFPLTFVHLNFRSWILCYNN